MSFSALPIIDIAPLRSGDPSDSQRVGEEIQQACTEVGFFYIIGHGVPEPIIEAAMTACMAFFRRPLDEKKQIAANRIHRGFHARGDALMKGATKPDYKEFFQIGLELGTDDPDVQAGQALRGPNQWPMKPDAFRPAMEAYFAEVAACGDALLRGVALGLGIDPGFFQPHYTKPLQRTQAVYYPPQPEDLGPEQFGVAPHTDFGCITLLVQDDCGGLEVQNLAGDWVAAPPIEGSFVVNVGDLLERWSNGRFKSDPHRVVNRSGRERLSIATFYDPNFDAMVNPGDLGFGELDPAFEPMTAGAHILGRIDRSFGYRKSV